MSDFIKNEKEAVQLLLDLAKQNSQEPFIAKALKEVAKMIRKKPDVPSEKITEQLFNDVSYWREQCSMLTCRLDKANTDIARLQQVVEIAKKDIFQHCKPEKPDKFCKCCGCIKICQAIKALDALSVL